MGKSELTTGTQAIDRATALLSDVLQSQTPPLLGSLARAHDIPKSTTSRILGALERAGLVQRDRNGAFLAGQVLTSFAREQNQDSVLVTRMRAVLESLSEQTGETANLAVPGNGFINLLDQVDGQYLLGATNWIGKQVPYHASALGKVLLAYSAVTISAGRLERLTDKTITSRTRLLEELEEVRRRGFAIISDELEVGLVAVAAPIREQDGRVVGAISVSGPSTRLNNKELIRIGDLIVSEIDAVQARSKKKPQMPNQKIGKVGAA
ncbi:IclR family transcriptional regulator [Candidatus Planktophila limnetica]|uniref:IclR family transcriptional regulator n=1 Tax=Candidatus Planktophila limnetica TaxID=573600 RepID=A0A249LGA9_9ACTN|nr:IclR family transcriptional regulator [Candidatus Planktophila limnetica]ASY27956.1 IclR family transcriptional regulator [Candidatus Planktophila limnetica]